MPGIFSKERSVSAVPCHKDYDLPVIFKTYLLKVVLHVIDFYAPRRALQQDCPRVLCEWYGAEEDHQGDKHACCRVRVETRITFGLPDNDGGDNDANVVDGVANDMDQNSHHTEVMARLLKLGHVVTVLCMRVDGLCWLVSCMDCLCGDAVIQRRTYVLITTDYDRFNCC